MSEAGFQATLIETLVMGNKRKVLHIFRGFTPHLRKDRSFFSIFLFYSMNFGIPVAIIIRDGFYQTIKRIHNLPVTHYDDADAARTSDVAVSRLEIYSCEVREIGNYNLIVVLIRHLILVSQHGKCQSHHLQTYTLSCNIDPACHRLGKVTTSLS